MSIEASDPHQEDPITQAFREGLEHWELPIKVSDKPIRTRGAAGTGGRVKTRSAVQSRGTANTPTTTPPEDDMAGKSFIDGLDDWERPSDKEQSE